VIWAAVLLGSGLCYGAKLIGLSVPRRFLDNERVRRIAALLPIALISSLVVIQTFTTGQEIVLDERALGVAAALVAIRLRAPFLVTVSVAAVVAALARLWT